jgi:zinc protease
VLEKTEDPAGRLASKLVDNGKTVDSGKPAPTVNRNPDVIAQDPSIRHGVLPNGMRYSVMRNATPAGAVSMRLFIDAGSFLENDDERGVAHFLEHMAFNGTQNFPEDALDRTLAPAGVQFGRDHNAQTSYFSTVYMLDLPGSDAGKMDLAFKWMRDVADGMTIDPAAVVRERGVVVSELNSNLSQQRSVAEAIGAFVGKGLRTPERDPIGTRASIMSMTAPQVRAFYERWYRPENAVIVVVGDVPVDQLEARVRATFSSWRGKGVQPTRPAYRSPDLSRRMEVMVRSEPTLPTFVMACQVAAGEPPAPQTVSGLRLQLEHELWQAVLNERFVALASAEKPAFLAGVATYDQSNRESAQTCLMSVPLQDDWKGAMDALSTEARRFIAHGPTQDEFDRAVEGQRALLRGASGGQGTRQSSDLASTIIAQEADGSVSASPDEYARVFERAVANMTPETLRRRAAQDWSGNGPLIVLTAPEAPATTELVSAWTRAQASPTPGQFVAAKPATWAYTRFGRPGRVARRQVITPPGFVRLTFDNGVVVNFKQTAFAQDRVNVRVRFGAGRSGLAPQDLFTATIGSELLIEGGLGKHDADTVRRIFSDRGWGADTSMLDNAFIMEGLTATNGLESELQILAAYLSDPGFRPSLDARLPTAIDTIYRMHKTDPSLVLSEALSDAVTPNSPLALPPRERLSQIHTADFARLFKPLLTTSPLEVTIVGDIDEADMTSLMSRTLGALPRRSGRVERRADAWWARYPAEAPPVIRAYHEGPAEKAVVAVVWPLYVADPARRREEFSLNLVASIMDFQLRHRIREELGKSYAPSASISMPDFSDQGAITVMVETAPEDAEAVAREIQAVGAEIARGNFGEDVLDDVRTPFLEQRRQSRDTNDWWLNALDGSAADSTNLNDFMTYEDIFRNLTLTEIKTYAAKWISRRPVVAIVTPSPRTGQTAAEAAAGSAPAAR